MVLIDQQKLVALCSVPPNIFVVVCISFYQLLVRSLSGDVASWRETPPVLQSRLSQILFVNAPSLVPPFTSFFQLLNKERRVRCIIRLLGFYRARVHRNYLAELMPSLRKYD